MGIGDGEQMETDEQKPQKPPEVYVPGKSRPLKTGEEWDYDPNAYRMFHEFSADHPCLSFDPLIDNDGFNRTSYPAHCSLVCGTQAARPRDNEISVMRLVNLTKMKHDDSDRDSDSDSSTSSESDTESAADADATDASGKKPRTVIARIPHHGGVNRIRAAKLAENTSVCAVWNDAGKVQIWNLANCVRVIDEALESDKERTVKRRKRVIDMKKEKPLHTFSGHLSEGFAVDWSPVKLGMLSSGDNKGRIHIWHMAEGGVWHVDQRPYVHSDGSGKSGTAASVEDLQWSPVDESVLCSVSSDSSIILWDTRISPTQSDSTCIRVPQAHHGTDVNVCSWNRLHGASLIVTGGDDGVLNVWDLKGIQSNSPVATFKHHTGPITSVHWCPGENDGTVFSATGEDNQTTLWDLSVESDEVRNEGVEGASAESTVPPQLLFVHMGQEQVKEVRFHPNLLNTTITTAVDGFNIFRTISL